MNDEDMELAHEFAARNSEQAFATLVQRHINLVYSVALRRLGNIQDAEEVTQAVFVILARKADRLGKGTILSGWLYQAAQHTAANFQRAAQRRQRRDQEAYMQFAQESQPDVSWQQLSPLLDEAMAKLRPNERDAVVLRFFENRPIRDVAAALGLKEHAAQKRISRATEKLRQIFIKRGIQVSVSVLPALIGSHAVHAAPANLAVIVTNVAASKGAAVSGSTLTLIKRTLQIMAWTKAKVAVVNAVLVAGALTTALVIYERAGPNKSETNALGFTKPNYWPKDQLAEAGYATPLAALKTTLWAMSTANMQSFLSSCTPQLRAEREKAWQNISQSDWTAEAHSQFGRVTGFRIVEQKQVSVDTVVLRVFQEGENNTHDLVFKKVDNEWKYAK